MKISLEWLSDFVSFSENDPHQIAEVITEKSAEVDEVLSSLDAFKTVVTGKLLSFTKLEDAKKDLFHGKFDLGEMGKSEIVFGKGENFVLEQDGIYPVALPGTELPTGISVKSGKLYGAQSDGMVCTEAELGTSYSQSGLITFPAKTELGKPVMDVIKTALECVVIGQIIELKKHPNADTLSLTKVKVSKTEEYEIVCGGSNLKLDAKVPVALVGANLWGEIKIKTATIRDIESNGMICSTEELRVGPSENKEIYLLPNDAPLGESFFKYIFGGDAVLDVENTTITNRPDLFSHIGFARECVACGLGEWKDENYPIIENTCTKELPLSITIRDQEKICPRYMSVYITGVDGKLASPEWMQRRLESCGIRPISALVDVTNYAMLERGIPLHAFDASLVGKEWTMRSSKEGEKVVTLDEIERDLPEGTIVLEDEKNGIFDLCGIMGGRNSGIEETTKDIILHAPIYDPIKIRRTALALAHRTEAAMIYEKGIPPQTAEGGFNRAIELILEIFPDATIESKICDLKKYDKDQKTIEFDPKLAQRIIGIEISKSEIKKILEDLGFFLVETKEGIFDVNVPAWRNKDISIAEDLAEEVARIYGLNRIPAGAPNVKISMFSPAPHRILEKQIARKLVKNGFYEIVTLNFLGDDLLKRCGFTDFDSYIKIANPLSADLVTMRPSLSPRLFETAEKNSRYRKTFRIFESGNVFKMEEDRKVETHRMTGLLVGDDFLAAKAIAEEIIEEQGWTARFEEYKPDIIFARPGRGAIYKIGKSGVIRVFEVHPKTTKEFGLVLPCAILCLDLKPLAEVNKKPKKIAALPKFQEIPFDFSVLCDRRTKVSDLLNGLEKLDERIYSSSILEVWEGKGVPEGQKSVTFSFEFRAPDRTLREEERDEIFQLLLKELEQRGATFRFSSGGE